MTPAQPGPRRRRVIILAGKIAIAALLVGWLVRTGTLDFAALRLFVDEPALLAANLATFSLGVFFGALRWRLLLGLVDVRVPVGRVVQLQLVAMFFNVVLPGNIGGDVVKAVYVARDLDPAKRPAVYLITLVDRLVAVAGLVVVGLGLTLSSGRAAWADPARRQLTIALVVVAAIGVVAVLVFAVIVGRFGGRVERRIGGGSRIRDVLARLVAAARVATAGRRQLLAALALAISVHATGTALFAALASSITSPDAPLSTIASVYPLGMLTLVVPISYAGIGVGHVAFDQLFEIVGLAGGATAFNVYLIGQTTPCLFGVLPYLALRRRAAPPTDVEADAQRAGADRAAQIDYDGPR